MSKKIKVMMIADHPLSPSGVGTQTKYVVEALLKSGRYSIFSLGGAMKHVDYRPIKTEEWGDDWVIYPVDGYGTQEVVRSVMRNEKPDILWFMTDPRFYEWLWLIENEIRPNIPMVYYHVWDNLPYPKYNKKFYESNDVIACISKVTHDIVQTVTPDVDSFYVPHAVDPQIFKPQENSDDDREAVFGEENEEKFIVFWNNRNARRKMSGSIVFWFKEFLDKVGHDKSLLVMHTNPKDEHGQDLEQILKDLELDEGQVRFSTEKVNPEILAKIYSSVDCTINVSDAEGFGLATLESLSCGTPIVVNMTGGLQEQVTDGENWFGIGIEPASKAIIGSQQVPYIYEDRINKESFVSALQEMYDIWKDDPEKYEAMSKAGIEHVKKNYNFKDFENQWVDLLDYVHEKHGSWKDRKGYQNWKIIEVV